MNHNIAATAFAVMIAMSASAHAQSPAPGLADHSKDQLRQELEQRYGAALQATKTPEIVRSEDSRYTWASEAKVECGIAIGFLKSGTRDRESIERCDDSYNRMLNVPPPAVAEESTAPPPVGCTVTLPILVYYDWDIDVPPAEAQALVSTVAAGMPQCGWTGLTVNGHADKTGSDDYNLRLSERRAQGIARLLEADGVPAAAITIKGYGKSTPKIDTAEGVREPMNRRVEISATAANR